MTMHQNDAMLFSRKNHHQTGKSPVTRQESAALNMAKFIAHRHFSSRRKCDTGIYSASSLTDSLRSVVRLRRGGTGTDGSEISWGCQEDANEEA